VALAEAMRDRHPRDHPPLPPRTLRPAAMRKAFGASTPSAPIA